MPWSRGEGTLERLHESVGQRRLDVPKDEASPQDENNAWQQQGYIGCVHGQEDGPARPVVLILKPLEQLAENAKALHRSCVSRSAGIHRWMLQC